jgi:hypothetical protein
MPETSLKRDLELLLTTNSEGPTFCIKKLQTYYYILPAVILIMLMEQKFTAGRK